MLPFNVAIIIPTGIGAQIGGFGGDAMPLLPLLASICDVVITHPNVANAACFQTLPVNTLYVEGYALDRFFEGTWALQPVRQNRVGILWDSGIPEDMEILHRNTIAAVAQVYGVDIAGFEKTAEAVSLQLKIEQSGRSAGSIENVEVLYASAEHLLQQGATAIAVCCLMPSEPEAEPSTSYQTGQGIDPIAGLEAMISHFLVYQFQHPCAHAPVFSYEEALPVTDHLVDPRAASEFIVPTFLPCVLTGLARAPQYLGSDTPSQKALTLADLSALVVPGDALGSLPVLAAIAQNIPVLAITQNQTVMNCPPAALGLENTVITCNNYMEAIGKLVALKAGVNCLQF